MEVTETYNRKEVQMVYEIILLTVIGEAILINGIATWFRYTDELNELKGEQK